MFKIRASGASKIMTDPKGKTVYHYKKDGIEINTASFNKLLLAGKLDGITCEVEEIKGNGLSETCKKYLKYQWVQDHYNRDKDLSTPAIQKGLMNEEQAMTMLAMHYGDMMVKNEQHREDDFKKGTPDIVTDIIRDLKCSWDIFTFIGSEITPEYDWQLQCYMHLWGVKESELVYVLTDTPESLIHGEVRSILWKLQETANPGDARYEEIYQGLHKQRTYNDIPLEDKIKIFPVIFDQGKIEALHQRVTECRDYYDKIKLNT